MKLIAFTINKLWGDKNISIVLNEDVNIFSGINGSGKTTILNILSTILVGDPNHDSCADKYESATLKFSDDYCFVVETVNEIKELRAFQGGESMSVEELLGQIKTTTVSTFDTNSLPDEYVQKLKERYPWAQSELDYELADAIFDYYMYIVDLANKIRQDFATSLNTKRQVLPYFKTITELQKISNNLYAPTLNWNEAASDVQFMLMEYNKKVIMPGALSSGEKQLLLLLLNTFLQKQQEYIVFWDEPEISMHVDWQKALIETMQQINPNMQLFIATHSPFVLFNGWENRVINLHSVLKRDGK